MTNGEFVDDKKIKDILTYIKSMKHSEHVSVQLERTSGNKLYIFAG